MKSRSERWAAPRAVEPAPAGPSAPVWCAGWSNETARIAEEGAAANAITRGASRHFVRCLDCGREFPGSEVRAAYGHAMRHGHRLVEVAETELLPAVQRQGDSLARPLDRAPVKARAAA